MALKKETQIIIALGTASIIGYLYFKNKKKSFSSFSQSDYDACIAQQGNQPVDCCAKVGGDFVNGVCNQHVLSCPGGTVVNGLCVETATGTGTGTDTDTSTGTGTGTTTTITNYYYPAPMSRGIDVGEGSGGGGGDDTQKTEFDWIPIILGGATIALSLISENEN